MWSEAPTRQAAAGRFASQPSTISAVANIPLAKLTELLNAQVPTSFEAGGNGKDVCIDLLLGKACAGTKYEIKVLRSSTVVSGAGPQTLRVTMPITFSGKGGLRGDGARLLNVDAKNFDGALLARVDFAVSIDDGGCPKLDAKIGYDWMSNPRVEIARGVNVDVTGAIEPRINEKLPELIAAAKGAIDCRKFKSEIGKLYASRTFPVDVPRVGVMHLNVMPLRQALRRSAFYDFGPDISRAKQGFSDAMRTASLGPGMTIAADNIDMLLGRIAVAERELMVEGLLGARLTISTPA